MIFRNRVYNLRRAGFLISIFLGSCIYTSAQPQLLLDSTISWNLCNERSVFYGFHEGDKIVLGMAMIYSDSAKHGREFDSVVVMEIPPHAHYHVEQRHGYALDNRYDAIKVYKREAWSNREMIYDTIPVLHTSMYQFLWMSCNWNGPHFRLVIKRIPGNKAPAGFNSHVTWLMKSDTTFKTIKEKYAVRADTGIHTLYNQTVKLKPVRKKHPRADLVVIPLDFPDSTIGWSYYIATGEYGIKEFARAFTVQSTRPARNLPGYTPMAEMAIYDVGMFMPQLYSGEEPVYFWFLGDTTNFFSGKTEYNAELKEGDHKSCLSTYHCLNGLSTMQSAALNPPVKNRIYLVVKNCYSNTKNTVTINVTAVTADVHEWAYRDQVVPDVITSWYAPDFSTK